MFKKVKEQIEIKRKYFTSEEYEKICSILAKAEGREAIKKEKCDDEKEKCDDEKDICVDKSSKQKDMKHCDGKSLEINEMEHCDNKECNKKDQCDVKSSKEKEMGASSDDLKTKGNNFYKNGEYEEAILTYTEAIEMDPLNHVLYSNRAAAYAKLDMKENGIEDCQKAIELNKDYVKAYIRLGDFYCNDDKEKAEEAYKKGLEVDPTNVTLSQKLSMLKSKTVKKGNQKFDINEMMNNPEFVKMAQNMMGNKSEEEINEMVKNLMNRNKN